MTLAPKSAKMTPQLGPITAWVNSTTLTPESGKSDTVAPLLAKVVDQAPCPQNGHHHLWQRCCLVGRGLSFDVHHSSRQVNADFAAIRDPMVWDLKGR